VPAGLTLPLLLAGGAGAAGLLLLAIARPAAACAVLAVAIPLTAGMERGAVVPVLRVNEALLLVVTAGVVLGRLPRRRELPFTGLDLAVLAFCAGTVLIPWAVILLSRTPADQQDWVQVLGPVQYLVVYLLFSRTEFTGPALRRLLNALMLASIPVAVIALLQLVDLGGVRELVNAYYPTQPLPSWDTVYRPASLLGFYSAVGAFGLLNFLLALALSAGRHAGFSQLWLLVVMGVNVLGVLASATLAPLLALPIGAAAVLLVARRVPWDQVVRSLPLLAVSGVALWPQLAGRIDQQLGGGGAGLHLPETLATRLTYWEGFFVPALVGHGLWLGTGTLMPSEVPRPLVDFVDNGYLWQWFRAGVPGVALYVLLLVALAATAWAARRRPDPDRRAVGAACAGVVASMVLVDVTSEYLTFTAVSQEFWMLAGVLTGLTLRSSAAPAAFVELGAAPAGAALRSRELAARLRELAGVLRGLLPEGAFVRSSLAVVAGFGVARLLGFAFQVAAGRLLAPGDYGRLTYALAVAAVLSVLLTTAPLGLSRFLARHAEDRPEQGAWYGGWLAAVGLVLAASALVTAVAGPLLGLGGWLLAGLLANLLGVAALETYREVQRGLGRYALQAAFYVVANAAQLAAVLALSAFGQRTPALFLLAYGLSSVGTLLVFAPLSRGGPPLGRRLLRWARVREVFRFLRPVLLQAVLWNVWFFGDLILVEYLRGPVDTGTYGAAKAIANGFAIVPAAISFVLAPRVSRLADGEVRGQLGRALALTAAVVLPLAAIVAVAARPLTFILFGGRYEAAAAPLAVLAVGMALYGLMSVLGALWLGIGRPVVDTVATGAATVVGLAAGVLLIPRWGPLGAAVAFSAGAAAQLVVAGAVTISAFARPRAVAGPAPAVVAAPGGSVTAMALARLLGAPVALTARLSGLLDDVRLTGAPRTGRLAALRGQARRTLTELRGFPRLLLWGDRVAYEARPAEGVTVEAAPQARSARPLGAPRSDAAGLLGGRPGGLLAAAARLAGIRAELSDAAGPGRLLDRAVTERWPLLHSRVTDLDGLPEQRWHALSAYVQGGGTLYVDGVGPGARPHDLAARLGLEAPDVRPATGSPSVTFAGEHQDFAGELAGARIEAPVSWPALEPAAGWEVLTSAGAPVVLRHQVGHGAVVVSTGPATPQRRLADSFVAGSAAADVLIPLLLLRGLYGTATWRPPAVLANCSIDDPALRRGLLGLRWDVLLAQALDHGFHATIATIPRELPLADASVPELLRRHPDLLSACYHGCDHDGYEFYAPDARRTRHAARPLAAQREALRRAVERGRAFTARHGVELDRVMVFPHGPGPAAILPELRRLGFVGSANFADKEPPGSERPGDEDLGLRPADVAWSGFPLLWRRGVHDRSIAVDLLLGRPVLAFAHPRDVGPDFQPLVERAAAVARLTGGRAVWCGLDEVARHAYLQRRRPDGRWQVLMTANEACLHNPDPEPRTYAVLRPHRPPETGLEVAGALAAGEAAVTVAPGRTAVVRVVAGDPPPLAARRRCSIFPGSGT
jgi:O-antigen/teichoic acid export membrane protein